MKSLKQIWKILVQQELTPEERLKRLKSREVKDPIVRYSHGLSSFDGLLYQLDKECSGSEGAILYVNTLVDPRQKKEHDADLEPILVFACQEPLDVAYLRNQVTPDALEVASLHKGILPSVIIFCKGVDGADAKFMKHLYHTDIAAKHGLFRNLWAKNAGSSIIEVKRRKNPDDNTINIQYLLLYKTSKYLGF